MAGRQPRQDTEPPTGAPAKAPKPLTPHQRIIRIFGGPWALGRAIGRSERTVENWQRTGYIPARQIQEVYNAACRLRLGVKREDFLDPYVDG